MTDILNLDALKVTRLVVLDGRERTLRSMTVEQFIEADDFDARLANATGKEKLTLLIGKLLEFLDGTTHADLLKLDMTQLMALLAFARGSDLSKLTDAGESPDGNAAGNAVAGSK